MFFSIFNFLQTEHLRTLFLQLGIRYIQLFRVDDFLALYDEMPTTPKILCIVVDENEHPQELMNKEERVRQQMSYGLQIVFLQRQSNQSNFQIKNDGNITIITPEKFFEQFRMEFETKSTPSQKSTNKFHQNVTSYYPQPTQKVIKFYHKNEPYFEFTNFFQGYPIVLDGKEWPATEHYFQAHKFTDPHLQETVRQLSTPRECYEFVRKPEVQHLIRRDWPQIKENVMYRAVKAKFTQHSVLRNMLLQTGDALLVEHTTSDNFWGDGGDGRGQNKLGLILMRVREELRNESGNVNNLYNPPF